MNRVTVAGIALLLVGVGLFAGGTYATLQQEARLSSLDQVNGTVTSVAVEETPGGFVPNVTYRYSVGGERYVSNRVFPSEQRRPGDREYATEVVGRYEAGDTVTVYLIDGDPDRAALRAPRSPTPIFAVGFGFVATAFGVAVTVAGRQRGRPPRETDEVTLPDTEPDLRDANSNSNSNPESGDGPDPGDGETGGADDDPDEE